MIGYSGGGTLAQLVAEKFTQTRAVVTLAGNLDLAAWVQLHDYTPLGGSLNPAERPPLPGHILQIHYVGKQINREKLLRYIVSFRQHNEFHEQCVERIFCDLMRFAQPQKLTVYARYTRRGGLDINPFRSNFEPIPENQRLARQ